MTVEEISKNAAAGIMPEVRLSCPERCLYYALKDIYARNRNGDIGKAEGRKMKEAALRQFQLDVYELNKADGIYAAHAKLWKDIEVAGSAYKMEPTIEHADAFVKAVYGVGRRGARQ